MKISVIVVTFNEEKNITSCLESLLNQSRPANEILVVDDGSTDATLKQASKFSVKIIALSHQGRSTMRNIGFQGAIGDYIIYAEADSIFDYNWIKNFEQLFKNGSCAVVDQRIYFEPKTYLQRCFDANFKIRYSNYKPFSAWAFKKQLLADLGGYNISLSQSEERELGKRIKKVGINIDFAKNALQYHKGEPRNLKEYLKRAYFEESKRTGEYLKMHPGEKPWLKALLLLLTVFLLLASVFCFNFSILAIFFLFIYLTLLFKIIFKEKSLGIVQIRYILGLTFLRLLRNFAIPLGFINKTFLNQISKFLI